MNTGLLWFLSGWNTVSHIGTVWSIFVVFYTGTLIHKLHHQASPYKTPLPSQETWRNPSESNGTSRNVMESNGTSRNMMECDGTPRNVMEGDRTSWNVPEQTHGTS